jgi:hypothetical protein
MEKDMHEQKMKIEEQRLMIEEQQYRIDLLEKSIIVSEQKRILDGRANEGQKRLLDRPANEDTEDDAVLLKKVKIESTI